MEDRYVEYKWIDRPETCAHRYIVPVIIEILTNLKLQLDAKILDAGCGGGALINTLYNLGFRNVWGFDASESGIQLAKKNFPKIANRFFIHNVYESDFPDSIPQRYNLIISMEVIEHLYSPQDYLKNVYKWLENNGCLVITTPYHGYIKNLILALTNKFDRHFNPLGEDRHIKFFSKKTLFFLLNKNGFKIIKFIGVGRIPYVWKSMVLIAEKKDEITNFYNHSHL